MKAELRVAVVGDRVVDLATDPPLGAKVVEGESGPVLYLVNTAASLLEDDDLFVDLRLGHGARLTVRSVAAQVAHPCLSGGSTSLTVRASVAAGAVLRWSPEPMIICAQGNHRSVVEIDLDDGGTLDWTDEVVLGRSGEQLDAVGYVASMCVRTELVARFEDGLALSPATARIWRGPAVLGDGRYLGSRLLIEGGAAGAATPAGWTPLAAGGRLARVVHADPLVGRQLLAAR